MEIFKMKLLPEYFNFIKYGTKRIELRLNDEKRKSVKTGDIIVFEKVDKDVEFLNTRVKRIYKYSSFKDLLDDFSIELLADKTVKKEELLEVLNNIYSLSEQDKYGTLGIEVELI